MKRTHTPKAPYFIGLTDEEKSRLHKPFILGLKGSLCIVKINLTEAHLDLLRISEADPDPISGLAMIDTGAGATSVDEEAVRKIGAKEFDRASFSSSLSKNTSKPICSITITINDFKIEVTKAVMSNLKRFGLISIIGRDLLSLSDLRYEGHTGNYTLDFPGLTKT